MIYGSRAVSSSTSIPLHLLGRPLEFILRLPLLNQLQHLPLLGCLFVPPIDREVVADVLIRGVTGQLPQGVYNVDRMLQVANSQKNK
jgi:hypothetical protein